MEIKRYRRYVIMALVFLLVMGIADTMGFFLGMDFYTYDLFFRLRGTQTPPDRLMIVAVDEKSLEKLGQWPIPRKHYAEFLERTEQSAGILSDIIMAEPSKDDFQLKTSLEKFPNMVFPAYVDRNRHLDMPATTLGSPALGHIHTNPGMDGVVRQVFHNLIIAGKILPSSALTLSKLITDQPSVTAARFRESNGRHHSEEGIVSILQEDAMWINYYGPPGTIPKISFSDVLDDRYSQDYFNDKVIVLGLTAAGIDQDHIVSFSQNRDRMPGVEIQATILGNLLDRTHIQFLSRSWQWIGMILLFLVCSVWFARLDSILTLTAGGILFVSFIIGIFMAFSFNQFWVPPSVFFVLLAGSIVLGHIIKIEAMGEKLSLARQDWEISFNAITDAIIIQDNSGHFILSNRSATQGALEVLERHSDSVQNVTEPIYDQTLNRYFDIQSYPRFDRGQKPEGSVNVVQDVTESIRLKQEQKSLQAQLIQSQKMEAIGTLAGGIAHDFNNILASIMGYTQLAAATIPEEKKARQNLDEVLNACSQASGLVSQILNFSRSEPQEKAPLMVRLIVKEVVQLLKGTLPPSIQIKADATLKDKIVGDPGQIYQVVLNLCTNAYQAIGEGPGEIKVIVESIDIAAHDLSTSLGLASGKYVSIRVSDTGPGIPEEIQNRVFEPYFTTKEKGTGTGLGLATIHGIVKNHGGGIRFDSWKGKGTCFHVYLPMAETDTTIGQGSDKIEQKKKVKGSLLLVDDRKTILETNRWLLKNMGYIVEARNCPANALEIFTSEPDLFDAVITDFQMKNMTGISLAEKLLKVRTDIPVILCTGYHDRLTKETASSAGVSAVVEKPYPIQELSRVIQSVMSDKENRT